jgi:hypothetical protein
MRFTHGGAFARLVAGGAAAATAVAGFTIGLAAPAHAAPVGVTTTLTDQVGNTLDGRVTAYALQGDGTYAYVADVAVADGLVRIDVEPGTYKFYFSDEDALFVGEYYSDKQSLSDADPVGVSGPTALAGVSLAARPTLSGQVLSPSGRPVEDARITIFNAADNTPRTYARTKVDGTWAVGVDAGSYKAYFEADGYAFEYFNNKPTLVSADAVAAGANLGQTILSRGSVVQGNVTSTAGVPLERARATAYNASGLNVGSDLTDAAGNYRIEGLKPGTHRIQFTDPVREYLAEWNTDKPTRETADPVEVGVEGTYMVNAALAPDPDAVVDPATVDASGVVVDSSGAPVVGAQVLAYDTPLDTDEPEALDGALSNRAGQFHLTQLSETTESDFKIKAEDVLEREEGQYVRLDRWFGGAQTYDVATPVTKPASGLTITLPLTGGVSGTISSESGLAVEGTAVRFFDDKGNPVDDTTAYAEEDGTYVTTNLVPGTYKAQFIDFSAMNYWSYDLDVPRAHAPEWYDNTSFVKAKKIVVKSGQTVTGIDAALSQDLRAFRKPEINGKPYLGGKIRAYPGVWSVDSGTTYTYQWLIGDKVVGTGASYKVTRAAKNKRVALRVTAENGTLNGTALVSSQVIKKKPKVKVAVKGAKASILVSAKKVKPKKFKGTVVVKKIVRTDDYGAPVYKKIGKATLRNGKATLTLKKLTKGKNKVVFLITLKGGKYGNAEVNRTIKVKKR